MGAWLKQHWKKLGLVLLLALVAAGAVYDHAADNDSVDPPAAAAAAAASASPGSDEAPKLAFTEEAYSFTPAELKEKPAVELLNDTARRQPVTVSLSDLRVKGGTRRAQVLPNERVVTFAPAAEVIAPAGTLSIELRSTPNPALRLANGTYAGWLTAHSERTGAVARAPFSIVVEKEAESQAEPLVKKLTVQAVRWGPMMDRSLALQGPWVPLGGEVSPDAVPADIALADKVLLGGVTGEDRGAAAVVYDGAVKKLSNSRAGVKIKALGTDGPGKYTGTIDLQPSVPDAGDVELMVVVKDSIIWAILMLGAGIGAAILLRHHQRVRRPIALLAAREAEAVKRYPDALQRLKAGTRDQLGNAFSTRPDFSIRARKLRRSLEELADKSFTDVSDEKVKQLLGGLETLEDHLDDLAVFPNELRTLKEALDAVDGLGRIESLLPDHGQAVPEFSRRARDLLKRETLTLDEFEERQKAIEAAANLAVEWQDMVPTVLVYADRLERLQKRREELSEASGKTLHEAGQAFRSAWVGMWEAPDAEAMKEGEFIAQLKAAQGKVAGLLEEIETSEGHTDAGVVLTILGESGLTVKAFEPAPLEEALGHIGTGGTLRRAPRDPAKRAEFLAKSVRSGDRWVVAFAAIAALASGLTALYWGKTWGTPLDYLTALLWGATTAGALDTLGEAIQARLDPAAALRPDKAKA